MILNPLLVGCVSLILFGCAADNSSQDYKDQQSEIFEDSIDDNIEFVNLNYEYASLIGDAHSEVTEFLDDKDLNHTKCRGLGGISVEIITESHFEINKIRESGVWGDAIAHSGTVSGFFDWSKSDDNLYKMYVASDGSIPLDEIFVHEYTHAYFFANCVLGSNNLLPEEEESYAEKIRKNYTEKR